MPNYDYKCNLCESEWEDFKSIEDRHNSECKKCGINGTIKISLSREPVVFQAQYFEHITDKPVYAGSKKELKEHLKRHDCYMPYAFY